MEFLFATLLAPLVDPAPGLYRTVERSRQLGCERASIAEGVAEFPGRVLPSGPRGDFVERGLVVCRERLLAPGVRSDRDEAVLIGLQTRALDIAAAAGSIRPDLQEQTWLVEVNDPSGPMVDKLAFAVKNALMEQGMAVSDRRPRLAIGDIEVLTRMEPGAAYPAACQRYQEVGSLRENDVLLAVVTRDIRDTALHAGLCVRGEWTWLR